MANLGLGNEQKKIIRMHLEFGEVQSECLPTLTAADRPWRAPSWASTSHSLPGESHDAQLTLLLVFSDTSHSAITHPLAGSSIVKALSGGAISPCPTSRKPHNSISKNASDIEWLGHRLDISCVEYGSVGSDAA